MYLLVDFMSVSGTNAVDGEGTCVCVGGGGEINLLGMKM